MVSKFINSLSHITPLFALIVLISCSPKQDLEMVYVDGGKYLMGIESPRDFYSTPIHEVELDGFYISKTEVTQALYEKITGRNPSFKLGGNLPVDSVSWYDAIEFCNLLSMSEGLNPVYKIEGSSVVILPSNNGYRLPFEAEWEFAARGAMKSKGTIFAGSNEINETAWYYSNSKDRTHEVAQKLPNEIGIYDVLGNTFEWCNDWFGPYQNGLSKNPRGPETGEKKLLRGGSFSSHDYSRNVSSRDAVEPSYKNINTGIRLVREL